MLQLSYISTRYTMLYTCHTFQHVTPCYTLVTHFNTLQHVIHLSHISIHYNTLYIHHTFQHVLNSLEALMLQHVAHSSYISKYYNILYTRHKLQHVFICYALITHFNKLLHCFKLVTCFSMLQHILYSSNISTCYYMVYIRHVYFSNVSIR